jgi:hypothetical protein
LVHLSNLGITYSIFAAIIWPAITLVVNKEFIGIAIGITAALQNLGLVIFPLIIAFIQNNTKDYDIVNIL